jgi:hypothetical protein
MDNKFDRLENKIDLVIEKIHSIDKTLERNTVSLEEHMRRTNALELKLEPVERHVSGVSVVLKAFGWCVGIIATLIAISKAVK